MADKPKPLAHDDLLAAVLEPGELVDYQRGAIVSRAIVDKPTGTVTVFAFDAGQALSEHTAPFDAMVQVLDGEVELTVEGKSSRLARGQMLIMPAHKPHAVTAITRFKMLLTMIRS